MGTEKVLIERQRPYSSKDGIEIQPQTRGYMYVIPTFPQGEPAPAPYSLEPDPRTQAPDPDAPDFEFRPLEAKPISDTLRDR